MKIENVFSNQTTPNILKINSSWVPFYKSQYTTHCETQHDNYKTMQHSELSNW